MNVSLQRIHAFLAVAELCSFTRAAEDLNLSQPALSARVRNLETDLGLKLFSRTTRSVQLTPDGERLFVRAQRATEEHLGLRPRGLEGFFRPAGEKRRPQAGRVLHGDPRYRTPHEAGRDVAAGEDARLSGADARASEL